MIVASAEVYPRLRQKTEAARAFVRAGPKELEDYEVSHKCEEWTGTPLIRHAESLRRKPLS
jgi:hypothetical protein